ncbi:MAG: TolC family protein [Fibrobacteres bacterium]|nr:TolC family protein [Fibrobacterota bacterium]
MKMILIGAERAPNAAIQCIPTMLTGVLLPAALALATAVQAAPVLTLDQALAIALDSNRNYRISELDARTAAEAVSWGRAGALPSVDASGSYVKSVNDTRQVRVGSSPESVSGAESSTKLAGINGTWTVFEGLSSLAAHKRLEASAALSDAGREQARQTLASQVILGYSDVVRQSRVLAAMDSTVALSRERVKITQGKYGFGGTSKLELLQAQLDLNSDRADSLKQSLGLDASKRLLNRLLTRPDTLAFEAEDSIPLAAAPDLEGLRGRAIEISPSLRQAALTRSVSDAAFREYVGKLFPAVGLSLGYNYNLAESQAGFLRTNEAEGVSYGINVKMNLFDGFTLRDDWRAAKRSIAKADLQYQEARAALEAAFSEAAQAYRASMNQLALETSNVALARENMGIAMQQLRLGTIASLELRAAQEKFVAAETRLVSARFESKRAETELLLLADGLAPK